MLKAIVKTNAIKPVQKKSCNSLNLAGVFFTIKKLETLYLIIFYRTNTYKYHYELTQAKFN